MYGKEPKKNRHMDIKVPKKKKQAKAIPQERKTRNKRVARVGYERVRERIRDNYGQQKLNEMDDGGN